MQPSGYQSLLRCPRFRLHGWYCAVSRGFGRIRRQRRRIGYWRLGLGLRHRKTRRHIARGRLYGFLHRCFNQRNEEVAICKRTALMKRKAVA